MTVNSTKTAALISGDHYLKQKVYHMHQDGSDIENELLKILGSEDKEIGRFRDNFEKLVRWREVIKGVVYPLESLLGFLDEIEILKKWMLDISDGIAQGNENKVADASRFLSQFISENELIGLVSELRDAHKRKIPVNVPFVVRFINQLYSSAKHPVIREFMGILDKEASNLSVSGSISTGNSEEIPSFEVFVETVRLEIQEYLERLGFVGISGDDNVLSGIMLGQWLKEQKGSSYVKLPFFDHMIEEIEGARRNGKVGQVVLKGSPGTGKTRIFEHLGEKLRRPIKVISMHEYINFYELLIQSTNLSPSKNHIDLIETVIRNYQGLSGEELLHELGVLFEKNRDRFPDGYGLLEFISGIFDPSKYLPGNGQKKQLESLENPETVKRFVIDSLSYSKNERVFSLLLNKKEVIEGELLSCINNGQIPVLDEIDKVKEKEINGILAFLDLETGRNHRIQGMDREIFIPEWFGVYATSNDDLKPSGPLGRRFNSVYFDYLDLENMTMYVISRIVDRELSCPFDNAELEQIRTCLRILNGAIRESESNGSFRYLDFSIRLLDNFVNGFIRVKDGIVQKKSGIGKKNAYIYEALENAFAMQTEDVLGTKNTRTVVLKDLGEQKSKMIGRIQEAMKKSESDAILSGPRLAKGVRARVNGILRRIDLKNVLLQLVIQDKRQKHLANNLGNTRVLSYSEQVSGILDQSDRTLKRILGNEQGGTSETVNESRYVVQKGQHEVSFEHDNAKGILTVTVDGGKKIHYGCVSFAQNGRGEFLVNQGKEDGGYVVLSVVDGAEPLHSLDLSNQAGFNTGWTLREAFFFRSELVQIADMNTRGTILRIGEEVESHCEPDISVEPDESGSFLLVYSKNRSSVSVIPMVSAEELSKKYAVSYSRKVKLREKLLGLSVQDFGLERNEAQITNVRFDSTFEYAFIEVKPSDSDVIVHTIKI